MAARRHAWPRCATPYPARLGCAREQGAGGGSRARIIVDVERLPGQGIAPVQQNCSCAATLPTAPPRARPRQVLFFAVENCGAPGGEEPLLDLRSSATVEHMLQAALGEDPDPYDPEAAWPSVPSGASGAGSSTGSSSGSSSGGSSGSSGGESGGSGSGAGAYQWWRDCSGGGLDREMDEVLAALGAGACKSVRRGGVGPAACEQLRRTLLAVGRGRRWLGGGYEGGGSGAALPASRESLAAEHSQPASQKDRRSVCIPSAAAERSPSQAESFTCSSRPGRVQVWVAPHTRAAFVDSLALESACAVRNLWAVPALQVRGLAPAALPPAALPLIAHYRATVGTLAGRLLPCCPCCGSSSAWLGRWVRLLWGPR